MSIEVKRKIWNNQVNMPLSKIRPNPLNDYPIENLDEMIESLRSTGLITPLSVIGPFDDGTYTLISGERRYRAMLEIRKDDENAFQVIPAYIVGDKTTSSAYQKVMINYANISTRENVNRTRGYMAVMAGFLEMSRNGEMGERNIASRAAKLLGTSRRYNDQLLKVLKDGPEELRQAVANNQVSAANALKIMGLPENERLQFMDYLAEGLRSGSGSESDTDEESVGETGNTSAKTGEKKPSIDKMLKEHAARMKAEETGNHTDDHDTSRASVPEEDSNENEDMGLPAEDSEAPVLPWGNEDEFAHTKFDPTKFRAGNTEVDLDVSSNPDALKELMNPYDTSGKTTGRKPVRSEDVIRYFRILSEKPAGEITKEEEDTMDTVADYIEAIRFSITNADADKTGL